MKTTIVRLILFVLFFLVIKLLLQWPNPALIAFICTYITEGVVMEVWK